MSDDVDYWLFATVCFSCYGKLKKETRKKVLLLVCVDCGAINASVEIEK